MARNRPFDSAQGRRVRVLVLIAIVAVLGAVLYAVWPRQAAPIATTSNRRAAAQSARGGETVEAPDVHLEALQAEKPKPDGADRNLFRFKAASAPPKPPAPPAPQTAPMPPQPVAPAPPTVPPIPLRFIGVMTTTADGRKQAILRDDRGVYYGAEGAEIDGRYKILRVGEESIEIAYLDGSGRQTLRKSGS